ERRILLLEKGGDPLLHLDAALRQGPGLDGQEPDPRRRGLSKSGDRRKRGCGRRARHECATIDQERHLSPPVIAAGPLLGGILAALPLWSRGSRAASMIGSNDTQSSEKTGADACLADRLYQMIKE